MELLCVPLAVHCKITSVKWTSGHVKRFSTIRINVACNRFKKKNAHTHHHTVHGRWWSSVSRSENGDLCMVFLLQWNVIYANIRPVWSAGMMVEGQGWNKMRHTEANIHKMGLNFSTGWMTIKHEVLKTVKRHQTLTKTTHTHTNILPLEHKPYLNYLGQMWYRNRYFNFANWKAFQSNPSHQCAFWKIC